MNKKAIATDAIAIIAVLFFTIIITTGTLYGLNFATKNKQRIEANAESINQAILLKNYLRTPININGKDTNIAELIIHAIPEDTQSIESSLHHLKPFFWEFQIFESDKQILTIKGTQNKPSKKEKIIQEQEIPNFYGKPPPSYVIKIISKKIAADLGMGVSETEYCFNNSISSFSSPTFVHKSNCGWTYNKKSLVGDWVKANE